MAQIFDGKHLKRSLEAHTVLYLALSKLYHSRLIKTENVISKTDELQTVNTLNYVYLNKASYKKTLKP